MYTSYSEKFVAEILPRYSRVVTGSHFNELQATPMILAYAPGFIVAKMSDEQCHHVLFERCERCEMTLSRTLRVPFGCHPGKGFFEILDVLPDDGMLYKVLTRHLDQCTDCTDRYQEYLALQKLPDHDRVANNIQDIGTLSARNHAGFDPADLTHFIVSGSLIALPSHLEPMWLYHVLFERCEQCEGWITKALKRTRPADELIEFVDLLPKEGMLSVLLTQYIKEGQEATK